MFVSGAQVASVVYMWQGEITRTLLAPHPPLRAAVASWIIADRKRTDGTPAPPVEKGIRPDGSAGGYAPGRGLRQSNPLPDEEKSLHDKLSYDDDGFLDDVASARLMVL